MKITNSIIVASLLTSTLAAAPISNEDGFGGFIAAGVTTMELKNNMIAGSVFNDEMTDKNINTITNSADSKNSTTPSVNYNFKYTFADIQTEIFLGTQLQDVLSFDRTNALGIRKNFDGLGIFSVAVLASSMPTQVWEDPYATDKGRDTTDMTSSGLSVKWEGILESNFDLELRARTYDIDDEKSGETGARAGEKAHGLTDNQLNDKLDREGDVTQTILSYRIEFNDSNSLKTSLRYSDYDLDGDAMEHKKTGIKLDYLYIGSKWNFAVSANVADDDYDNKNPLYNDEADATIYGGSLTAMYKDPFGWSKNLSLTATLATYEMDSDIDFYDASMTMANVGILYKF